MDNYKELRKLEISLEGKLSRKLNKVFKEDNVNFKIEGYNGPLFFNSIETGYTLFSFSSVRDSSNSISDLIFNSNIEKEIPKIVLERKSILLDIINAELKDYFNKKVALC
jgi:hypothetical protein